jgi:hypothetical protein
MVDPGKQDLPAQPATPSTDGSESTETGAPMVRRQSSKYGQQPVAEGDSGRRARLRHPGRGAVRR